MKNLYEVTYKRVSHPYTGEGVINTAILKAENADSLNTRRLAGFQQDSITVLKTKNLGPVADLEVDFDLKRNKLSILIDADAHIEATLEKADIEEKVLELMDDDIELDYEEALEQLGYTEVARDNTYNYCSDLSDELDLKVFLPEEQDASDWYYNDDCIVLVRKHVGLDVRAGYKTLGLYKPNGSGEGLCDFIQVHVYLEVFDLDGEYVDMFDGDGATYNLLKEYTLLSVIDNNILVAKDGVEYQVSISHPVLY